MTFIFILTDRWLPPGKRFYATKQQRTATLEYDTHCHHWSKAQRNLGLETILVGLHHSCQNDNDNYFDPCSLPPIINHDYSFSGGKMLFLNCITLHQARCIYRLRSQCPHEVLAAHRDAHLHLFVHFFSRHNSFSSVR